jgi:hypothetical protein
MAVGDASENAIAAPSEVASTVRAGLDDPVASPARVGQVADVRCSGGCAANATRPPVTAIAMTAMAAAAVLWCVASTVRSPATKAQTARMLLPEIPSDRDCHGRRRTLPIDSHAANPAVPEDLSDR